MSRIAATTDLTVPRSAPTSKRDATRRRLLDAANRLFRERGFDPTTTAAIAAEAGVTERTFFRYFPAKADVLVANWQLHGERLREVLRTSDAHRLADVVRDALLAFTDRLAIEIEEDPDSAAAFLAITQALHGVEQDLALEIGRRLKRPSNDFEVRLAANAATGVIRASIQAYLLERRRPMADMIDDGMYQLRSLFAALPQESRY
jgi:TetR/AcrR family transcriptional regulator, regulator of mycofactocin system